MIMDIHSIDDTILYAKQTYIPGYLCTYPEVFAGPNPTFYLRIRKLCEQTINAVNLLSIGKPFKNDPLDFGSRAKKLKMDASLKVLILLVVLLFSMIIPLLYLAVRYPLVRETFVLVPSEKVIRELNVTVGKLVLVWLSTIPPGESGRYAMGWVIEFYVTDPSNQTVVYEQGVAGTGPFSPESFIAQQDGVYTMHFDNTVGDPINKTVRLSYRMSQPVFGISVDLLLFVGAITVVALIIVVAVIMLVRRRIKATPVSDAANPGQAAGDKNVMSIVKNISCLSAIRIVISHLEGGVFAPEVYVFRRWC